MTNDPFPLAPPQIAGSSAPQFLAPSINGAEGGAESFGQALALRALGIPIAVVGTVAFWEALRLMFNTEIGSGTGSARDIMPSTVEILSTFGELLTDGFRGESLLTHLVATVGIVLISLAISLLGGGLVGGLIGTSSKVRALLDPFLTMQRFFVPAMTLGIAVAVGGFGSRSRVWAIALPIGFFVAAGVARAISKPAVSTVDGVFSVVRSGLLLTIFSVGLAESLGAENGLFVMSLQARNFLRTDVVMVAAVLVSFIGFTLDTVVRLVGRAIVEAQR